MLLPPTGRDISRASEHFSGLSFSPQDRQSLWSLSGWSLSLSLWSVSRSSLSVLQPSWSWSPPPLPPPPAVDAADVMLLVSSVTAPPSAKTLPITLTPVVTVSLVKAIRFPTKAVAVPRVEELTTCQNTLPARAPLARTTEELLAVVSVLPIWKT